MATAQPHAVWEKIFRQQVREQHFYPLLPAESMCLQFVAFEKRRNKEINKKRRFVESSEQRPLTGVQEYSHINSATICNVACFARVYLSSIWDAK